MYKQPKFSLDTQLCAPDRCDQDWWEAFCAITAYSNEDLMAREETERAILNEDPADIGGEG